MERVALIDIAGDDDLLLLPCPTGALGCLEDHGKHIPEGGRMNLSAHHSEQPGSPERKKRVPDMYNLRRSLAWDSAFFTSEGVLNPEELAKISNFWSMEQHTLPGVPEEFYKSSETCTTLANENILLPSLEIVKSENLHHSIKRSPGRHDGNCNEETQASRKTNIPRPSNPKTPVASMRCPVPRQGKDRTPNNIVYAQMPSRNASGTRGAPNRMVSSPQIVHVKNRAGKALPGHSQVPSPKKVTADKLSSTVSKRSPAKKASSGSKTPTKTLQFASSAGSNSWICSHDQTNKSPFGYGKVATAKKAANVQPPCIIPRPSPQKRAASSSTPIKMQQMASPAHSGSWSSSMGQINKLSLNNLQKRGNSKNNSKLSSSLHDSLVMAPKGENISGNMNNNNATPRSIFGFFSSQSPCRSIDSFGSTSSASSTSTGRKRIGSMNSEWSSTVRLRTSSNSSSVVGSKATEDRDLEGNYCKGLRGQVSKPSGLRLPTPKIGYFDADKSAFQNSPRCAQRSPQSASLQTNCNSRNISGVRKSKINRDRYDSRITCIHDTSCKKSAEAFQMATSGSSSEVSETRANKMNSCEQMAEVQNNVQPKSYGKNSSDFTVDVAAIEEDQMPESGMQCFNDGFKFPELPHSNKTETIKGSPHGKMLHPMSRSSDKENLFAYSKTNCCNSRNMEVGGPKVAIIDDLEKRLCSLKLSLNDAAENARDLLPFIDRHKLVPEKVESLQSSLKSLSMVPVYNLQRTPLSETN